MKRFHSDALIMALLPLLAVLAYANTFSAPFIFDDAGALTKNPYLGVFWPIVLSPRWLVDMSFKFNFLLHGYQVAGYHAVNLLIHIAAGLLLYGIVRRTLNRPPLRELFGAVSGPLALTVAALWTLHPLQTESVTYLCQRYESLMGLCLLATLYAFIRSVASASARSRRLWADLAVVTCALGMGTKEVMVVTPLMVWLYDALFVGGSWSAPWRRRTWLHAGLFLTIGILVMFELLMMGRAMASGISVAGAVSPALYLATQTEVILHYLRLSFVPTGLCLDYAWPMVAGWSEVWLPALLITCLGLVSLWALLRRHPSGFAGAMFFLLLAPTSSLLPVPDVAFEHRMYLPLACVIVVAVTGGYRLLAGRLQNGLLMALAAALALTLTGLTFARNNDYRSELAMWRDVVAKRPENLRAGNDLAIALAKAGKIKEAAIRFDAVLAAIPSEDRARFARGEVLSGSFPTMSSRYHYFRAHANYGKLLARSPGTREQAIRHYVLALRAAPHHPAVEANLRGALREAGVPEAAIETEILKRITAVASPAP